MVVIVDLFAAFLSALGLHQLYAPTQKLGPRMGALTRYAIGTLSIFPFFAVANHRLRQYVHEETTRVTIAYLLTLLAFGGGSFIAHALDRMKEIE